MKVVQWTWFNFLSSRPFLTVRRPFQAQTRLSICSSNLFPLTDDDVCCRRVNDIETIKSFKTNNIFRHCINIENEHANWILMLLPLWWVLSIWPKKWFWFRTEEWILLVLSDFSLNTNYMDKWQVFNGLNFVFLFHLQRHHWEWHTDLTRFAQCIGSY